MFDRYGPVSCISCKSSMRLVTIVPGEAGLNTITFKCRNQACALSRDLVVGRSDIELRSPGTDVPRLH
jgi:hypothetical protein